MHSQPPPGKDEGFQCPAIAETQRPFHIKGNFNGDFSDTNLMMGDQEVEKLVESPRAVFLESPSDVIGKTMLNFSEGNVKGTCELRNISVHPSVGKFKLKSGETTSLTVIVKGLEGLEEAVPLHIKNKTPEVVSVKGEGTIDIQPSDVKPGGILEDGDRPEFGNSNWRKGEILDFPHMPLQFFWFFVIILILTRLRKRKRLRLRR